MSLKKIFWNIKRKRLYKYSKGINKNVQLEDGFDIGGIENIKIAANVYIGPDVWIDGRGGLDIEEGTILGPRIKILTFNHRYENAEFLPYDEVNVNKKVKIGKNVWIGSDVLILPGSIINEGVIVGAGSVVHGELNELGIYAGNPAKIIKIRDKKHYQKLKNDNKIYMKFKNGK